MFAVALTVWIVDRNAQLSHYFTYDVKLWTPAIIPCVCALVCSVLY